MLDPPVGGSDGHGTQDEHWGLDAVHSKRGQADEGDKEEALDAGRQLLVNHKHVAGQSVEDSADRIGLKQLYGTEEQVPNHLLVKMFSSICSDPLAEDVVEVGDDDDYQREAAKDMEEGADTSWTDCPNEVPEKVVEVDPHGLEGQAEEEEDGEEPEAAGAQVLPVDIVGDGSIFPPLLAPFTRGDQRLVILVLLEIITEPGHSRNGGGSGGESHDLAVHEGDQAGLGAEGEVVAGRLVVVIEVLVVLTPSSPHPSVITLL